MSPYLQAVAGVLLASILGLVLGKTNKESGILLTILVCCMLGVLAVSFLRPVTVLIQKLRDTAALDAELLGILLKAVGVGFLGELTCLVCADAGCAALGKALQILTAGVILYLSIPLLEALLELVSGILGEV